MPASLRQLFYVSRVADGVGHRDVRAILEASRRRNRMLDVTGCLACSGRHFAQVIEGRADAVAELAARIAADPRHTGLRTIVDRPVTTRQYALWSMAVLVDETLDDALALHLEPGVPDEPAAGLRTLRMIKPDTVMGAL